MRRGELFRRAGLAGAFALLLVVCIAAPVLAQPVLAPAEEDPVAHQEALESPQAVAEREDSEYAYVNLTPAEEESLLRERFAPQLQAIDADPARALADVVINRLDTPTEALVTVEGEKVLLESEVPLRAPEEDGDLHKVELELEETAAGFEPANPLVDLSLPDSADEPIQIGEEGLAITPLGTVGTDASPLGEEDLFLPAAHEDTSLLLSPIAGGVELSALLTSRSSPQQLAFKVTLPSGATLSAEESGGATVVRDGDVLATVSAPHAIDAQGTEVPVGLSVEGDTLTLSLAHREMDVAYPLFIDPQIEENWSGFADTSKLSYWKWSWGGVGPEDYIGKTSCIVSTSCWGNGLYVRARSNFTYPAGSWARWWFTPQGSTTYMRRVILGPINYNTNGCWANEPHAYTGVWNDNGNWEVLGNAYPTGWMTGVDVGELKPGTRTIFVGFHAGASSKLTCGRDYRFGGATLFLDDPEYPTAGAPSGYPTGWIKDGQKFTVSGPGSDPGLGLKKATFFPKGSVTLASTLGCDGHYTNQCPANHTFQFAVGADSLDEGEKPVSFKVEDILEKPSSSQVWNLKVDRTPPEVDLAGQLAIATGETGTDGEDNKDQALSLPVYNLQIDAIDGKLPGEVTGPEQKRSGVKRIEVFLDQKATPEASWEATSCPGGNCPLSKTFALKLNQLSAGTEYTLRLLAHDFAGNAPRERKVEFEYIPATGMKEEYVMQYFPLPDGSGNEDEEEHPRRPELAVNLVNGNLVYRQKDVEVETASADLEVELYYNSLLPESQNTEWGDGWTMAEEPALEIEDPGTSGPPTEATIVEDSGAVESSIALPTGTGESTFDKRIQATVTKEPGGGYELTDESGETSDSMGFSSSGQLQEVENGTAATVEYEYEGGALAEIAIEDPGTANVAPGSLNEDEVHPDLAVMHSTNLGTYGSADGQFKSPADVVADAQGNLYVLDSGNGRIQKFGPNGQFLAKFGSPGYGAGQINGSRALALDGAGNILVAEYDRIQKFSSAGQYLGGFGSFGYEPGQIADPTGIAVGVDGTIWVSDSVRVQRLTAAGQFIETVGSEWVGGRGLEVDSEGNVYVVRSSSVAVYSKEGDFLRKFGSSGTGPGQFSSATEIDVDAAGNAWVADDKDDRIQLFNAAGDYIAQFGSPGTGAQQFKFDFDTGIAADGKGRIWIADAGNHRLSKWVSASFTGFFHSTNLGTYGSADGQFKSPTDVVADAQGNLYVLDSGNGRIQKFGPNGQFLAKFGSPGYGAGQLSGPRALALDGAGNILVAEYDRIQKFSPAGQYLGGFGSYGYEPGQFAEPTGIAVGVDGTIWVGDWTRVQRFTAAGQFIETVGPEYIGSRSLDIDSEGNAYVVRANNVTVYDKEGNHLRKFGSSGTGPGQFSSATEIDVDADGNAWVADDKDDRIQLFNSAGDYIAQFGSPGTGAQQFKLDFDTGIAADGKGRIWIADAGNHRAVEWLGGNYEPSNDPVLTEDDPQLEVNVSAGLVESVEGEEVGTVSYGHSGDLLTSVDGPDTEADFSYDSAERMTKVTLANGTYAEIAYEPAYGRVKSVAVAPEGANKKTTFFNYSDEPRRTTVVPPDGPITTYDFAADGSVFKWWNSSQPPVFDDIAGSLYENRETSQPIAVGAHTLNTQAHSDEGIASIQIIANNNQLVDEKTCEFNPEEPGSCVTVKNEWVTETDNWPPGIVYLEVIATDRLGISSSQRFWVNIPYTPPSDPEAEEPPRFSDILSFREEFGLDLDLKGDESAINDRIFDLIGAWHNPMTPEGEVARATDAKWGVPLRAVDVAELEYREVYLAHNAPAISQWGETQASSSYAGFYIDHRAGGVIRVGFTSNQAGFLGALKEQVGLIAVDRLSIFTSSPNWSMAHLRSLSQDFDSRIRSRPDVLATMSGARLNVLANRLELGSTNVPLLSEFVNGAYGSTLAINVFFQEHVGTLRDEKTCYELYHPRVRKMDEQLYAGDWIRRIPGGCGCTLAFGAWSVRKGAQGQSVKNNFALTAGHCANSGSEISRAGIRINSEGKKVEALTRIGTVTRRSLGVLSEGGFETDAEAVDLAIGTQMPRRIFQGANKGKVVINGAGDWIPGMTLCLSGTYGGSRCGATSPELLKEYYGDAPTWQIVLKTYSECGDSGSPIWDPRTGKAIALLTGGPGGCKGGPTWVTPVLSLENKGYVPEVPPGTAPGALNAPEMKDPKPLNIVNGVD